MRTLNSKTTVAALALLLAGFCFTAAAQDQSIAEAARKAREQKKTAPQAKRQGLSMGSRRSDQLSGLDMNVLSWLSFHPDHGLPRSRRGCAPT